jgi:energy-coupling factor transporter ATP-binding protein EcfA2
MTAPPLTTGSPGVEAPAAPAPRTPPPALPEIEIALPAARGVAACLARLDEGINAARRLQLDVTRAEAVRQDADTRLGFPAEVAVVALAGGTGVGKSTLLNALAGEPVSETSVRRPTTGRPVGWLPAAAHADLAGLVAWLDVGATSEHAAGVLDGVAILDLPDLDSLDPDHRRRVEELLPRIDAVIWVTDPEKYRDAVLHDDFLRTWLPRLDRQLVVLNKTDRLRPQDVDVVLRDLERSLGPDLADPGGKLPRVVGAAALADETRQVRDWLAGLVDTKRVVTGRIAASTVAALDDLARRAGIASSESAAPLLDPGRREAAIGAAVSAVGRLLDVPAARRQAVAATRAVARTRGTGPLGRLTGWLYRTSGRQARAADPSGWLRAWASRGSLAPALESIRGATDPALRAAPTDLRPTLAGALDVAGLKARIRAAVDATLESEGSFTPPASRLWPVLGWVQSLTAVGIAFCAAWLVLAIVLRSPVDMVTVPILGRLPIPFALLVACLITGFVAARVLGIHAGWLGGRWATGLGNRVSRSVEAAIGETAFGPLDRIESARRSLWHAARGARETCGRT